MRAAHNCNDSSYGKVSLIQQISVKYLLRARQFSKIWAWSSEKNKATALTTFIHSLGVGWKHNKLIENLSDRDTCYAKNEKQKMFWGVTGWLFYMG